MQYLLDDMCKLLVLSRQLTHFSRATMHRSFTNNVSLFVGDQSETKLYLEIIKHDY